MLYLALAPIGWPRANSPLSARGDSSEKHIPGRLHVYSPLAFTAPLLSTFRRDWHFSLELHG